MDKNKIIKYSIIIVSVLLIGSLILLGINIKNNVIVNQTKETSNINPVKKDKSKENKKKEQKTEDKEEKKKEETKKEETKAEEKKKEEAKKEEKKKEEAKKDEKKKEDQKTTPQKEVLATKIELNKTSLSIGVGTTKTLKATITPSNTTDKTVKWSSSDKTIATVDNGVITAKKKGTVTITAKTTNGKKVTCKVSVVIIEATKISLNKTSISLKTGATETLTATIAPSNTTDKTVKWSSSDKTIATVDNGVITTKKQGTATITAKTANGKTATCKVKVSAEPAVPVTGISLDKRLIIIKSGNTTKLNASVSPDNATFKDVTWTSGNPGAVTVESNGRIRAVNGGIATITAKASNGQTASCDVVSLIADSNDTNSANSNTVCINKAIELAQAYGIRDVTLYDGKYYIYINDSQSIILRSNINLNLNGAVLEMLGTGAPSYNMLELNNVQNVKVYNGKIIGDRITHDYSNQEKPTHEWGMGIRIGNSSNINIENMKIYKTTGDGIYITDNMKTGASTTRYINIIGNEIYYNRRNGITIIAGDHINIQNNEIHSIIGTQPQAGIDIERNKANQFITNTTINNNRIYENGSKRALIIYKGTSNLYFQNNELGDNISARNLSYCYWKGNKEVYMNQSEIFSKYNYNISGNRVISGIDPSKITINQNQANNLVMFQNPNEVGMKCDENSVR